MLEVDDLEVLSNTTDGHPIHPHAICWQFSSSLYLRYHILVFIQW